MVVTGQRKSGRLQDVPIAITAVNNEVAQKFGLRHIKDVGLVTLGADFTGGAGFLQVYIRGIAQAFPTPGFEPLVAIYLGGSYLQRVGGMNSVLELVDINRVEVVRSP